MQMHVPAENYKWKLERDLFLFFFWFFINFTGVPFAGAYTQQYNMSTTTYLPYHHRIKLMIFFSHI